MYTYKHTVQDQRYHSYEIRRTILEQAHLEKLNIVDLGVVSAPANDIFSTSGMVDSDGRCWKLHSWTDLCQGLSPHSHLWMW